MKKFISPFLSGNYWKFALGAVTGLGLFFLGRHFSAQHQPSTKPNQENQPNTVDVSSLSNLNDFTTLHLDLDIKVNFVEQILEGSVEYLIKALRSGVQALNFDVKNVDVLRVQHNENSPIPVVIKRSQLETALGNQLYVYLPQPLKENEQTRIKVFFKTRQTTDSSAALNWLTPEQTKGKKLPFVFTQCQAILCRTLFPCQDSPSVKFTYEAKITVPNGFAAFCSANLIRSEQTTEENKFYFKQEIPIPSYLFALVAGDLVEKSVSARTYVIAEPENMDACLNEFKDMENYLKTLERLITPYEWGVYKIVVLPPSFPYGGMENPLLTFISPTCVVGDGSQNAVIVHEMAHSWSGNLVSCKNWNSFWLNEGWTTFFENQACKQLFGDEYYEITTAIEAQEMKEAIQDFLKDPEEETKKFSSLDPTLENINPDDVFSTIPYVRGCQLLTVLQKYMGQRLFRNFIRSYINEFQKKSLDTVQFLSFLKDFIVKNDPSQKDKVDQFLENTIKIRGWINTPGQPPNNFEFDTKFIQKAQNLATSFVETPQQYYAKHDEENFGKLSNSLKIIFLTGLIDKHTNLNLSQIQRFHQDYDMKNFQNPEVNTKYYILCIKLKFDEILPQVEVHLSTIGRMKYIRPVYKSLEANGYHDWAEKVFKSNQKFYHSVASDVIKIDLQIRN